MAQRQALPYYQDMLKIFWTGVKRAKMYEYDLVHGYNCICCSKILQPGNDKEEKEKPRSRPGRKPGGHNKK